MADAIRINGLCKEYVIGGRQSAGASFRETVADVLSAPLRRLTGHGDTERDEQRFWALQDVSLGIAHGEVVGIIGRNGAGKSTLLKILSRITAPTRGEVLIHGRVASLLEVGTGFHPELTGRENVFLNGAILGMSRAEIRAKFDEIVDFAGVDRFIDTPVKRYSSGMQVRLAFAVAAHLEPEILIVDEVLAVGDAEFQKKCLGKMQDVVGEGRTVLFVSHNMGAVSQLCDRGVVLEGGRVSFDGAAAAACERYLVGTLSKSAAWRTATRPMKFRVTAIEVLDPETDAPIDLRSWQPAKFRIHYHADETVRDGSVTFQIATTEGQVLVFSSTRPDHAVAMELCRGGGFAEIVFDRLYLAAGDYVLGAGLAVPNSEWLYREPSGMLVSVQPEDVYASGFLPHASRCPVVLPSRWIVQSPVAAK